MARVAFLLALHYCGFTIIKTFVFSDMWHQLRNYTDKARIKCTLVQKDDNEEHPHNLYDEDEENADQPGSVVVPVGSHYKVGSVNVYSVVYVIWFMWLCGIPRHFILYRAIFEVIYKIVFFLLRVIRITNTLYTKSRYCVDCEP